MEKEGRFIKQGSLATGETGDFKSALIVSGHRIFRESLSHLLAAESFHCECADENGAVAGLNARGHHVVLIDHDARPRETVLDITANVSRLCPDARVLIIGHPRSEEEVLRYLEAGAAGYVSRDRSIEQLIDTIKAALRDEFECSPKRASLVFARLQQLARESHRTQDMETASLTLREAEILKLIDMGEPNKEIANKLHLSVHTVKTHVHHILEKMGAVNRRQAVYFASQRGWLSKGDS